MTGHMKNATTLGLKLQLLEQRIQKRFQKHPFHRPHVWWPLSVLWAAVIFYFSSQSDFGMQLTSLTGDVLTTIAHIIEYGILTWFLMYAFRSVGHERPHAMLFTTIIVIIYAFTDEFHQSFVPGRTSSIYDIGIDALTAAMVMWARPHILRKVRKRKKNVAYT
ncbi:MAG: hypothetical protein A2666_02015 [Parcubacteria group bacterium RIFCSPHIGHO2_01_FULL_47_10b]|nr:MAG: hypothetical protein A2666_02015 [Parcubacteria group bacterium RIFCSPHIGHO2_01_FULL_47_10b]